MSLPFQYSLHRYSRDLARRERSRVDFIHAESFDEAYRRASWACQAMARVDPSWEYSILEIRQDGVGGEQAPETEISFWPAQGETQ